LSLPFTIQFRIVELVTPRHLAASDKLRNSSENKWRIILRSPIAMFLSFPTSRAWPLFRQWAGQSDGIEVQRGWRSWTIQVPAFRTKYLLFFAAYKMNANTRDAVGFQHV
jgi:hypothetical protein